MGHVWVFYDPIKEAQSDKLTTEEAQFILLRLKTKFLNDFLVWREDWNQWKKLSVFLESPESPFMNTLSVAQNIEIIKEKAAALTMTPVDEDTVSKIKSSIEYSDVQIREIPIKDVFGPSKQQFDGDRFSHENNVDAFGQLTTEVNFNFKNLNKLNAFAKRNDEDRYKIEILLIHSTGHIFRTTAKDISLTGTFSERIIPSPFHHGIFDVIVINNMVSDNEYRRLTLKGKIVITDARTYVQFLNLSDAQKNSLRVGLDFYLRSLKNAA